LPSRAAKGNSTSQDVREVAAVDEDVDRLDEPVARIVSLTNL
jgi:hypothetical protein